MTIRSKKLKNNSELEEMIGKLLGVKVTHVYNWKWPDEREPYEDREHPVDDARNVVALNGIAVSYDDGE